jgi:holo-[acyl-carrier protein] synthase
VKTGPVIGTGIDLVENTRMREMLERWGAKFKDRVFLPEEQSYCETKAFPFENYAARFAVKEAVSKALGTGISPAVGWLGIEVVRCAESGAPSVRLLGRARAYAEARRVVDILISLSHTRHYAVAHALLIGEEQPS